jgi:hypothetical protein
VLFFEEVKANEAFHEIYINLGHFKVKKLQIQ